MALDAKSPRSADRVTVRRKKRCLVTFVRRQTDTAMRCAGQLGADISNDAPERARVREAFDALDDLLDVYTRHSVQFDGQVAPELSAARRLITSMQ